MNKLLSKKFSISENAGNTYLKASIWMCTYYLSNMMPVFLLAKVASDMLSGYLHVQKNTISITPYIIIGFIILLSSFYSYRQAYKYKYLQSGDEDIELRLNVAEKIRFLPMSYLGKKDLSDLISIIMDDVAVVQEALATGITEFISGTLFSIVCIIGLLFFNVKIALALAICIPFAALSMLLCKKMSHNTNKRNKQKTLVISDGIQEYLENVKILNSSPKADEYISSLFKKMNKTVPGKVLYEFLSGFSISLAGNVLSLGLGITIIVGSALLLNGEISVEMLLFFIFVSIRVYEPLKKSCENLGVLIHSDVSSDRIKNLLDTPIQEGRTDIIPANMDIVFNNVTFSYDNKEEVLHNLSFTAKQGEITALVGPSGCGKSTVCRLAPRFYDIEKGNITIGGIDIRTINPDELMKNFSFVFQDVILFNDTIYNNIKMGNKYATQEDIERVAKLSRCEDFIKHFPDGYQTVIGENGKTLSGGERQRLSIARAFLKDAPIILLDESTASIDPENESKIQEAIGELVKNKTVIMIAHRLRSIVDCDKIVVIEKGRVVESGTHCELIDNKGLYSKLYKLQNDCQEFITKK